MLPRSPAVPAPRDHRTESYLPVTFLTNSPRPRCEPPEVRDGVRCPHVSSASIGHRRGTPGSLDKRLVSARMSRWAPAAEGCWVNGARFPAAPLPVPSCEWLRVAAGAGLNVMSLQTPLLTPGACRPSPNRERQAPGGRDPYGRRNQARRLFHKRSQASPSVPKLWARLPPKDSERTESSQLPWHLLAVRQGRGRRLTAAC